jgi:hypothetical protein
VQHFPWSVLGISHDCFESAAVARDIRAIEDALVKLEHELETAEGERRATLERLVAEIRRGLKKVARIELH